ncbi:MAG: YggS family pyridoxal phosphate-dependent enzyme [Pseudomonadota bacterium]
MIRVTENLAAVRLEVENVAEVAGRKASDLTVVAVSKRHGVDAIQAAFDAGQRDFGENFVDEALGKIDTLADQGIVWHYIGAIQSNKTRDIATNFDWVHTVDREKIARRLSRQRPASMPALNVCIQVNIDNEPQKAGIDAENLAELAAFIDALPGLQLRGLMCLPRPRDDEASQRAPFRALADLAKSLGRTLPSVDTLSMGMSGDMAAAIREGATILRIGTAIFGAREP